MRVSEIRWREPMFGDDCGQHTFKVGDRVRIARIADNMTTRSIIGHRGIVVETDDIAPNSVEMQCATCRSVHTMHEQELDYFGDDLVQLVQEKAGVPHDVEINDQPMENLEDFLAVGMHKAGFERICIKSKPLAHGDPRLSKPVWAKYVYGFIRGPIAPLRVFADALIKIADEAGGYLAEWATFTHHKGYQSTITEEDLDTLTLEMPIRALMVAKATTEMKEYDDIKDMVAHWLQDKHQIDIGAIYRAIRDIGFSMGNWSHKPGDATGTDFYTMRIEWQKNDGDGQHTFIEWARKHWTWIGHFTVYVDDRGQQRSVYEEVSVIKDSDAEPAKVEEVEDVPF